MKWARGKTDRPIDSEYFIECHPYRISRCKVKDKWRYILWKTTGKNAAMLGVFNSADEAKEDCERLLRVREASPA